MTPHGVRLLLLLLLPLVLAAASCGGGRDRQPEPTPAPPEGSTPAAEGAEAAAPPAASQGSALFAQGVASGDPAPDRVMLWTRIEGREGEVPVAWAVYRDPSATQRVAGGRATARPEEDHTVRVDATGLEAGTTYYYRFAVGEERSVIGRTRTLPTGEVDRVRLAVVSCSNYPAGYFHAYRAIAERADIAAVLHLGDYMYEYPEEHETEDGERVGYGDGTPLNREPEPAGEVITLDDYRQRYRSYRSDPDLQEVHRQHPFIPVWDDHETANNSWVNGAENHDPQTEGPWRRRRAAALQAYFEWLPVRRPERSGPRLYRSFAFGELLDLFMLDGRLEGRDRQVDQTDPRWTAEDRHMLGDTQEQWLISGLRASDAAWRLVGQQTVFSPVIGPEMRRNTDQWDGYPAARNRILSAIAGGRGQPPVTDVVILSGDIHSSWAFEVPRDPFANDGSYDARSGRGSLAVELVTPATSSEPVGVALRNQGMDVEVMLGSAVSTHPHLKWVNALRNGYLIVDLTAERAIGEWWFIDDVRSPEFGQSFARAYRVDRGSAHLVELGEATEPPPAPALAP
ncbi:MAG: alkaline phosphatase D family protein [Sandaracinaceae bacterium]